MQGSHWPRTQQVVGDVSSEDDDLFLSQPPLNDPADNSMRATAAAYQKRWRQKLRRHERTVPGPGNDFAFTLSNLAPRPDTCLWQDAPHVPFDKLKSDEAQARLSACRPICGLQEAGFVGGVPTYAQNTGDVNARRRGALQLASTLGFVVNKNGGKFMNMSSEETRAVHECISWVRTPGNNAVLRLFGTVHEKMVGAFGALREALRRIIPEGHHRARVRLDRRDTRTPREADLGSTLEKERTGLVVVDQTGQPMTYRGMDMLSAAVAKQDVIIGADVPGPDGKGWARAPGQLTLDEAPGLTQQWREDLVTGANVVVEETFLPANDPHYDAKLWPRVHPYGTAVRIHGSSTGTKKRYVLSSVGMHEQTMPLLLTCFQHNASQRPSER